jgi:predicted nucleotidyltransferase
MARGEHHRIHAHDRVQRNRLRVAQEAARLMSEHGIRDFHHAKRKAAERLGVLDEQALPRNHEIEEALREHQRLFQADSQPQLLRARREAALDAMRFLQRFEPRLVGAVLEGTADSHSAVCLHVFSDDPEAVGIYLHEHGVPVETQTRRLRISREEQAEFPVLLFAADNLPFDLTVMPLNALRQSPLNRMDEKPMRRASLASVEIMLAEEDNEQDDFERKLAAALR